MSNSKYKVGDEVVFLTDSYNKGIRFTITKVLVTYPDVRNQHSDLKYSYCIEQGITVLYRNEEDLYWIPTGTIDRPKEN